jgi:energy-converting hydrogenase B subunit D
MIEWFLFVVVVIMLAGALMAMLLDNLLAATVAASVVSLGLAVIFVFLRAPDVAMTEAAVGAGLSSLILALGLKRLGLWKLDMSVSTDKETEKDEGNS